MSLNEQQRHNVATENLQSASISEQARHNAVTEREISRSNLAHESIQRENLALNRAYQQASLDLQSQQQAEVARANKARELEQARSNLAQEQLRQQSNLEQQRSNRVSEAIRRDSNDLQRRSLGLEQAKIEIQRSDSTVRQLNTPAGIAVNLFKKFENAVKETQADGLTPSQRVKKLLGFPSNLNTDDMRLSLMPSKKFIPVRSGLHG
nr:putative ORF1 [Marmot picobirnavirus]